MQQSAAGVGLQSRACYSNTVWLLCCSRCSEEDLEVTRGARPPQPWAVKGNVSAGSLWHMEAACRKHQGGNGSCWKESLQGEKLETEIICAALTWLFYRLCGFESGGLVEAPQPRKFHPKCLLICVKFIAWNSKDAFPPGVETRVQATTSTEKFLWMFVSGFFLLKSHVHTSLRKI